MKKQKVQRQKVDRQDLDSVKNFFRVFVFALLLIFIVFLVLKTNLVRSWAKNQVMTFLHKNISNDFKVGNIDLDIFKGVVINDLILYDDQHDTLIYSKQLELRLRQSLFSIYNNHLEVVSLDLYKTIIKNIYYDQNQSSSIAQFIEQFKKNKGSSGTSPFKLNIERVNLNLVRFVNEYKYTQKIEEYSVAEACLDVRKIDSKFKFIALSKATLDQASIQIIKNPYDENSLEKTKEVVLDSNDCHIPFVFAVDELELSNSKFAFHNNNFDIVQAAHFDPNHIELKDLNLKLKDFTYDDLKFYWKDQTLSLKDKNNFSIEEFKIKKASIEPEKSVLYDFYLKTNKSEIRDSLELLTSTYTDYKKFRDRVYLNLQSKQSSISIADLAYFIPKMITIPLFRNHQTQSISLEGQLIGKLNSIKSNLIKLALEDEFLFEGSISSRNLHLPGETILNIKANKAVTNMDFIESILNQVKIPEVYKNLGKLKFKGQFDGYLQDFVAFGNFSTGLGDFDTDMRMDFSKGKEKAEYSGSFKTTQFQLGELLGKPEFKNVNMSAFVRNGIGLNWQTIRADLNAQINSFDYKGKTFSDIDFNGKFSNQLLDGKLNSNDENLKFTFDGKLSNLNTIPKYEFQTKIISLNLKSLGLTQDSVIVKGNLISDLSMKSINDAVGTIEMKQASLINFSKSKWLDLKQVNLSQSVQNGNKQLELVSAIADINLKGQFELTKLQEYIYAVLWQHEPKLCSKLNIPQKDLSPQADFTLSAHFKAMDSVLNYLNSPIRFSYGTLNLDVSHQAKRLNLDLGLNRIACDQVIADSVYWKGEISSLKQENNFKFSSVKVKDQQILKDANFIAVSNDSIHDLFLVSLDQKNGKKENDIRIRTCIKDEGVEIKSIGDSLLVIGYSLVVKPDHYIRFYNINRFTVRNLVLSDTLRSIAIRDTLNKGLVFNLTNLNLELINRFMKTKDVQFYGYFDTELMLPDVAKIENISGVVSTYTTKINKTNFGRIGIDFSLKNLSSPVQLKLNNEFRQHQLQAEGQLMIPFKKGFAGSDWDGQFNVQFKNYPLSVLEAFIASVSETQGFVSGDLLLKIKDKKFSTYGILNMNSFGTKLNYLGVSYFAERYPLLFKDNQIVFSRCVLKDEFNNDVVLSGTITYENFIRYIADLEMSSDKALILNTTKKDNPYYYGYGLCKFNAKFTDYFNRINIDVKAKTLKGSYLTIPVTYDQNVTDASFVKFVNTSLDSSSVKKPSAEQITLKGMSFSMDLEVTDDAEVAIIFDESAGDVIKANGRGNIQFRSPRGVPFAMYGNYEVESGQYLFTLLNVVNKPFKIKRGGLIQWSGDPFNADINLEAGYEGLYSNMSTFLSEFNVGDRLTSEARNRTLIDLTMLLNGKLFSPDIRFKILFPELTGELKVLAENKIRFLEQNEDQLNQQVFGLLVFGTFFSSTNILENVGSHGVSNNITELLSNQFSLFASNLLAQALGNVGFISGVDFNVAYNIIQDPLEGYSQSEFIFRYKNQLWNDQWAVTLGGNYKPNSSLVYNTNFTPESAIEWNTPVPGLKLRVYYKSVNTIEGLKHKIGSGLSFRKEFDSFELFKKAIEDNYENKDKLN
ncbi:MAG TPA: translocation/assembly module TamB domain-containing protein [Saprospiraceae bacterium]|nr:translocation/assembly module TamB domain-containing protein [Saprospiraceae bacterium]